MCVRACKCLAVCRHVRAHMHITNTHKRIFSWLLFWGRGGGLGEGWGRGGLSKGHHPFYTLNSLLIDDTGFLTSLSLLTGRMPCPSFV